MNLFVVDFLPPLLRMPFLKTTDVRFDIAGEKFTTSGYRLIEANWKHLYPYFKEKKKR
jgi:DNA topoisomerase IA